MAVVRGKDFKLYRNTDTPYDNSPTWALVTNVRDLTRNLTTDVADASTRASSFKQQVATMMDLSVDFQMVYDGGSDADAFEAAFFANSDVELAILDGLLATDGSSGIRASFQVTKFTVNEALTDVGLVDVTVVPSYGTNLPRRVVAGSGALTDV